MSWEPRRDRGVAPLRSWGGGGAGSGTKSASDGARVLFGLESSIRAISATEEVSDPRGCGIACDDPRGCFVPEKVYRNWSCHRAPLRKGAGGRILRGMEGLVRCLRAAVRPDETSAPLVSVVDEPASRFGPEGVESFARLVAEHGAAASAGRAHAHRALVLAGFLQPTRYRADVPNATVVDLRSDPHGWVKDARGGGDRADASWRIQSHDLADVGALAATVAGALGPMPTKGTERDANDDDEERAPDADGGAADGDASTSATTPKPSSSSSRGKRSALHGRAPSRRARTCVAIDCVAELVAHNGTEKTLALIRAIRADPRVACVVAYLAGGAREGGDQGWMRSTTEGGDVDAVEALRAASSAYAVVSAAPKLTLMPVDAEGTEGGAGQPDAVLAVTHARPTGRTRTETDSVYASSAPNSSSTFAPLTFVPASNAVMDALASLRLNTHPDDVDGIQRVGEETRGMSGGGISAARAAAEAEAEAEAAAARRLQASVPFNLGVNPSVEEASARANVVLPFEHQGAGRHYDEGNFLAYLPRDAGGARTESGAVNKGRGHIMYVRDSDSDASAPDSDEELDEDIDI